MGILILLIIQYSFFTILNKIQHNVYLLLNNSLYHLLVFLFLYVIFELILFIIFDIISFLASNVNILHVWSYSLVVTCLVFISVNTALSTICCLNSSIMSYVKLFLLFRSKCRNPQYVSRPLRVIFFVISENSITMIFWNRLLFRKFF